MYLAPVTLAFAQGVVFFAEVGVDWVKHSFLTKFNRLSSDIYGGFANILVHDLLSSRRKVEVRCITASTAPPVCAVHSARRRLLI